MGGATPPGGATIALDLRAGDIWAWEKRLSGTCPGCSPHARISLRVNDKPVPAEREGDAFAAVVRLDPGENRVVAVATHPDGREDASAEVVHTVRLVPRPVARITLAVEGDALVFDGSGSEPSAHDGLPVREYSWVPRVDNPAPVDMRGSATAARASVTVPAADGEYYVSLRVRDEAGREDVATSYFLVDGGTASVPDPLTHEAAWIERAIVYGAIPRNFGDPGFKAVTARLDDLRDLGIAAIWLSPINRTPRGYFGYEVLDHFEVRQEYGTKDDFRELVREAHARGIRVLMDLVPNHTSELHPYYLDAQEHGPASPYHALYDRDGGGNATYYFWTHLLNLDYDNPEVWNLMLEVSTYWMREFGVDGYRVDVAWAIRERRPEFWDAWSRELNRIKPDSLLIAEATARDPFYFEHGFDAAYDWTDELGHWAWGDAFGSVSPMAQAMRAVLSNDGRGYHPDALIFRFLNNNDTESRFISSYGVDFYRVSSAMLLTLPGLPCLYTGDEVGAEFLPYKAVGPIDWTDRHGLRAHFRRLIALRREQPSLRSRQWTPLDAEPALSLFGYLRHGDPADPPVLVLLNFSRDGVQAQVPLPAGFAEFAQRGELTDLYANERVPLTGGDRLSIPVPAWGIRVLADAGATATPVAAATPHLRP